MANREVRFGPGTMVSAGQYRNLETGAVRWFDGSTPLPGSVNSAGWQQLSDHYHSGEHRGEARDEADRPSRAVRFAAGTVVSPGEYRNVDSGVTRYFDGQSPLPGGVNGSSWQQISDHHHPDPGRHAASHTADRPD